jgi:enamine deaminase RidA (YjgF/YER057c/UK114 family)
LWRGFESPNDFNKLEYFYMKWSFVPDTVKTQLNQHAKKKHQFWSPVGRYSRLQPSGASWQYGISGTAPVQDGKVQGDAAYEQTVTCLGIIKRSLEQAGASLQDVVRTRLYVTNMQKWEEHAKAHAQYFGKIKPATSMVEVSALIDSSIMMEIEATAIISERAGSVDY